MKKQMVKNLIAVILTLAVAATSILLPGFLIEREDRSQLDSVENVPPEYYSGPSEAMIENASQQLTSEQCLQLILGIWDSTISETTEDHCNKTEFGMKNILVNRVTDLHSKGLYPVSIASNDYNWYSWTSKPYRAIDTTFQTYAAYFWDFTFTKFDNSETHRFIVTESGDILYAEFTINDSSTEISDTSKKDIEAFNSFSPDLMRSSYLFYYYGEFSTTTVNSGSVRVTEHDYLTTSYYTSTMTDAEIKKLDTAAASSFITDFKGFSPDSVYRLRQSAAGNGSSTYFSVSSKKTDNSFQLLLQPLD